MRVVIRLIAAIAMAGSMTAATAATATAGEPGSSQQTGRKAAPQAQKAADATPRGCPRDRVCFYTEVDYGGEVTVINPDNLPGCDDAPRAKSIYNATNEPYQMFAGGSCADGSYLGTLHKFNGWKLLSEPVGSWTNIWG